MKSIAMGRWASVLLVGVSLFGMTGCEDKEAQAEIERLNEEAGLLQQEVIDYREASGEAKEMVVSLRKELTDAKLALRGAEGKLKVAERELARFRSKEEAEKTAQEREPSRREKQAAAKVAASEKLPAMVTIKGDESSSKGVLVEADEKTWVYFAPSMLRDNTKVEFELAAGGSLTKLGVFEVAPDVDLARIEVQDEVAMKLTVGEVGAMANGTALLGLVEDDRVGDGRSYGLEPTRIVADARFKSCALGTPVFHGETADFIGVMVEGKDVGRELWPPRESSRTTGTRDIARLDREIEWSAVELGVVLDEAKTLADFDRLTRVVQGFVAVPPAEGGLNFGTRVGESENAKDLFEENKVLGPVRDLFEYDEWLKKEGVRASDSDKKRKFDGVYGTMARMAKKHAATVASKKFSDLHAKDFEQSMEWRKEALEQLNALIKEHE